VGHFAVKKGKPFSVADRHTFVFTRSRESLEQSLDRGIEKPCFIPRSAEREIEIGVLKTSIFDQATGRG
jgi:hypothetical protein